MIVSQFQITLYRDTWAGQFFGHRYDLANAILNLNSDKARLHLQGCTFANSINGFSMGCSGL
jgi:hypothetical protein